MTPEGAVKNSIKKILDSHGVYYNMPVGGTLGRAGVLDFQCCVCGYYLAIEAKAGKGKPTELQKYEIEKIKMADGIALVINEHNLDELDRIIVGIKRLAE